MPNAARLMSGAPTKPFTTQDLYDMMDLFKYGRTSADLAKLTGPGIATPTAENMQSGAVDRSQGAYSGAQHWGAIPAQLVNNLALEDIGPAVGVGDPADAMRRKQAGNAAIDAATGPHNALTTAILSLLR